ncbi:unnamed protein product [Hymenolepis diminuta]|uniref:Uncharacterized protein n=1 Tax=Hymenolepis diminuta TaxID=6216 RepID=A0A564Z3R9_HYMDI|nr:unnamed protein product [Hymenolepis diminuta]
MFSCVLTQVTHIKLSFFLLNNNARLLVTGSYASGSSPLFLSTLPFLSLFLSLPLCHSFQTRCGFLEYIFGLICFFLSLLVGDNIQNT